MRIVYRSKAIEQLCNKQREAVRTLGATCARKLLNRLGELEAAIVATELVAGRPHLLKGDRAGQMALDLTGGARLTFSAADDPVPRQEDGSIKWAAVKTVMIEYIGDYHD